MGGDDGARGHAAGNRQSAQCGDGEGTAIARTAQVHYGSRVGADADDSG